MRVSVSLVVIGFAASIRTAAAQYIPPQPPPMGYPPPAYYSYRDYLPSVHYGYGGYPPPAYYRANPSERFQGRDEDADGEGYGDEYDRPYPPRRMFGDVPGGIRSGPLGPPPVSPQDHGTAVAALPPDYQPEQGRPKRYRPSFAARSSITRLLSHPAPSSSTRRTDTST